MNNIKEKKILLVITGSIAAYKSAFLTRLMVKAGAEVRIVMTPSAVEFITPLTLSTLSGNSVLIEMMKENDWNSHVDMGLWADLLLIAPATANSMAKMAHGIADNLAMTTYLSAKCPVMIAPAMDLDMWKHPSTRKNVKILEDFGHSLIPVGEGELASGLHGEGRMAEPEVILQFIGGFFDKKKSLADLKGKKVLITAGPTYESIDPVRFIGNHSSGKMGAALAEECKKRGAEVSLILGPSKIHIDDDIALTRITSASEMAEEALESYKLADIIILAAAVADYTPAQKSEHKIKKKEGETLVLKLERTIDIAASIGAEKKEDQLLIGFALETQNAQKNAFTKLQKKNFDFIVLNSLADPGAGFKHDTNKISILFRDNTIKDFKLKSKKEVASDIIDNIVGLFKV